MIFAKRYHYYSLIVFTLVEIEKARLIKCNRIKERDVINIWLENKVKIR